MQDAFRPFVANRGYNRTIAAGTSYLSPAPGISSIAPTESATKA